jgi:hypothetical protein
VSLAPRRTVSAVPPAPPQPNWRPGADRPAVQPDAAEPAAEPAVEPAVDASTTET